MPRQQHPSPRQVPGWFLLACTLWLSAAGSAAAMEPDPAEPYLATAVDPWLPNFAHERWVRPPQHVVESVAAGAFGDPATWSGTLDADAVVRLRHDVVLDADAAVWAVAVFPGGRLRWATDRSATLRLGTLLVEPGGTLEIGTEAQPIAQGAVARLLFRDLALNTADPARTGFDPAQYGNGLVALGTVRIHGAIKTPFARLAAEPAAGGTTLALAEPANGWRVGDRLVLPDSRHLGYSQDLTYVSQCEEPALAAMTSATTLGLSSPLAFAHPAALVDATGAIAFLPHVANLARNVVLASENPHGTHGHVLATCRADVDIRYALFRDLGRTRNIDLDSATFDGTGQPTHVGTNQIGRYPLHIHHLYGPLAAPANGFQYTLVGDVVDGGSSEHDGKWGITVHASSDGLVRGCVVYNEQGAGVVTESGTETRNVFERNLVIRVGGNGQRADWGTAIQGIGYWFSSPDNYVRDNIAASVRGSGSQYGFALFPAGWGEIALPAWPGADPHEPGQALTSVIPHQPIREFARNEVYGSRSGMTYWYLGMASGSQGLPGASDSTIKDLRIWNVGELGIFNYPSNRVVIDGLVTRGRDLRVDAASLAFLGGDYQFTDSVIRNADIEGFRTGIFPSCAMNGATETFEHCRVRAHVGFSWGNMAFSGGPQGQGSRTMVLRDCRFEPPTQRLEGPDQPIQLYFQTTVDAFINFIQHDRLFVYDYQGIAGNDFRVWYLAQAPDSIVPEITYARWNPSTLLHWGAPVAGLTNLQCWARYNHDGTDKTDPAAPGMAICGEISPSSDTTTHPEINGFTGPIGAPPADPPNEAPTIRLTAPADGASVALAHPIAFAADAADGDGVIAQVELYRGATLLETRSEAPFTFSWSPLAAGDYTFTAKAYDNLGASTISLPVDVTVAADGGGGGGGGSSPNGGTSRCGLGGAFATLMGLIALARQCTWGRTGGRTWGRTRGRVR